MRSCLKAFPASKSIFVFPPLPSMALGGARRSTAAAPSRGGRGFSHQCLMNVEAPAALLPAAARDSRVLRASQNRSLSSRLQETAVT